MGRPRRWTFSVPASRPFTHGRRRGRFLASAWVGGYLSTPSGWRAGGFLPALQQILGHADIKTTQRYGRLSDQALLEEANRIRTAANTVAVTIRGMGKS